MIFIRGKEKHTHTHTFSNNAERKDPLKILVETWEAYVLVLTKIPIS